MQGRCAGDSLCYPYVCVRKDGHALSRRAGNAECGRKQWQSGQRWRWRRAFWPQSRHLAAEPIEGTWQRPNGTLIRYATSGGEFCGTVMSGEYDGQSIGCMTGSGSTYEGEVNKLDEGKTYRGKASVRGDTMTLSGCVLGGLICKSEDLARQ